MILCHQRATIGRMRKLKKSLDKQANVWYIIRDMRERKRDIARNLKIGAVYYHDGEIKRLTEYNALRPASGITLVDSVGDGKGVRVTRHEVQYADLDEVQDCVEDCEVAQSKRVPQDY